MPSDDNRHQRHYQQLATAIDFMSHHHQQQPSLAEVAEVAGMSEFHFQRLFSDWVGVSPKQYVQFLTKESAKQRLQETSVLNAALDVGLSGPSRLHDLMLKCEGVTPGEYKRWGDGLEMTIGMGHSPFGLCALATTPRGVCELAFLNEGSDWAAFEHYLQQRWAGAVLLRDDAKIQELCQRVFPEQSGKKAPSSLRVLLKGSEFQLKVWEALLSIPEGQMVSYQCVAASIGQPSAVRAVATAIANNAVGVLIPCHRVIRKNAELSNYRWGQARKRAILAWEAARKGA